VEYYVFANIRVLGKVGEVMGEVVGEEVEEEVVGEED
jgi:hypothetical protein